MPAAAHLPLLISVPHGGVAVPPELRGRHLLTHAQIVADGDVGAAVIYAIRDRVAVFMAAEVARAFVDLNRAPDDFRKDGVVKTHTCWDERIYASPPDEKTTLRLLEAYHRPYHERLSRAAGPELLLAIDCHTMAALGPPVGPDPGTRRPWICLGNADGATCPNTWLEHLGACFSDRFDGNVQLNTPFKGGYITRCHGTEMPWVQLEMSRAPFLPDEAKRQRVLGALEAFCQTVPRTASERSSPMNGAT